jgi:hypothetical protein
MKFLIALLYVSISILVHVKCISETLNFEPNKPLQIKNPLLWGISATCKISTTDDSDNLTGTMIKGSGKINGTDVGTSLTLTIKNGDSINLSASKLAEVQIVNNGKNTVTAVCSLTTESEIEILYMREKLNEMNEWNEKNKDCLNFLQ